MTTYTRHRRRFVASSSHATVRRIPVSCRFSSTCAPPVLFSATADIPSRLFRLVGIPSRRKRSHQYNSVRVCATADIPSRLSFRPAGIASRLSRHGKTLPTSLLFVSAVGIVIGLYTYGHNVVTTIGARIAKITPSRGFSIELGAILVTITCTRMQVPLSSTQCQVGATVGVALLEVREGRRPWFKCCVIDLG